MHVYSWDGKAGITAHGGGVLGQSGSTAHLGGTHASAVGWAVSRRTRMKRTTVALLATSVIFLACGGPQGAVEELPPQAATVETFKLGVLVDEASPAKVAFTQAAHLAESQLNQGLMQSGIGQAFTLVVAPYAAGQARAVAIDLINNQGVLALVTDSDFTTADVNGLNYDFDQQVAHKFTITCTQCSSPRFNQFFESEPGFSDPENWLFRTYFNAGFEPAVQMH